MIIYALMIITTTTLETGLQIIDYNKIKRAIFKFC
jgi:hypothetical protein